ncbi:MAG: lipoprotein [Neisseria sp.]|nr:lipoprotein [Neisseria sp.]
MNGENMKKVIYALALAAILSGCASSSTGGFVNASNGGGIAGITQSFRW